MILTQQETYNHFVKAASFVTGKPYFADMQGHEMEIAWIGVIVAQVESDLNTHALNPSTQTKGLMQVKDKTKKWMEENFLKIPVANTKKMFDPYYNGVIGLAYLCYQFLRYGGNWERAVRAYHVGNYNPDELNKSKAYIERYYSYFNRTDPDELAQNYGEPTMAIEDYDPEFWKEFI